MSSSEIPWICRIDPIALGGAPVAIMAGLAAASIPILLYETIENALISRNVFVTLEIAELQVVDEKLHFDPNANKRKRHHERFWSLLLDPKVDSLLAEKVEEVEHPLQAVLRHLRALLSETRLIEKLIALVRSGIAALP
jgi:hypothetical protein